MEAAAKVTSKGQITIPQVVREALGIQEGDTIMFRVEDNRAIVAKTPDLLSLAGTIKVPAAKRNASWDEIVRKTRSARATRRL